MSTNNSNRAVRGGGQSLASNQIPRTRSFPRGQAATKSSSRGAPPTARAAARPVSTMVFPTRDGQFKPANSAQCGDPMGGRACQCSKAPGSICWLWAIHTKRGINAAPMATSSWPCRPLIIAFWVKRFGIDHRWRSQPSRVSSSTMAASSTQRPLQSSLKLSDCRVSLSSVPRPPRPKTPSRVALRRAHSSR